MKKRILFVLCTLLLSMVLCIFPSATELAEFPDTEPVSDTLSADTESMSEDSVDGEGKGTYHTLFTRLWEYVNENKTEVIDVVGTVIIVILSIVIKLKGDKKSSTIAQTVLSIKGDTSTTSDSQNSVVDSVNNMIDGYNALKTSYDKYGETEDDRNRVVGALVAQNTAILEILTTVYANSKNLPQGVKDLVNLKYANCLKSLDNDEQLKAIVTAVRENIGTTKTVTEEPEIEDETEV